MARRVRVVTAGVEQPVVRQKIVIREENPKVAGLTDNEKKARRYAATTSYGMRSAGDTINSSSAQFYSPQLSTDFLEKPQNLRERRAFYRFFYNTNEIVGRAIDIHSELPLSKLRLVPPKGKNKHMNDYVFKFFEKMTEEMKLFKGLLDIAHELNLFGNCVAKYGLIRTIKGYIKAEDISVGDYVLTNKGRYRKVIKTHSRPSDTILNIKCFKDYRIIPVTEEHPIEVYEDGKFVFKEACDLTTKDYVRVTWPVEETDIDEVELKFHDKFRKIEGGYEFDIKYNHPRSSEVVSVRKNLLEWLGALKEPVIRSYDQLSLDFKVSKSVLMSTVYTIDKELDVEFHRRVGASGWEEGSQVLWLPMKDVEIDFSDSYEIIRKRLLNSVDKLHIDNDLCYLAGFWLGDGTLSRDTSRDTWGRGLWQIAFKETCYENINRVRSILCKIFGESSVTEWTSEGISYVKVKSNPAFIEWWAENFGETYKSKNFKKIPEWVVKLPKEKLLNVLAGILDSDGCISHTGYCKTDLVCVSMVSSTLMSSIREIALKCGMVVNFTRQKESTTLLPSGVETFKSFVYFITSSEEQTCLDFTRYSNKKFKDNPVFSEKNRYWLRTEEGLAFKVKKIEEEKYDDKVYNFEVEEDHTFQVNGFSTHNCFLFSEQSDWQEEIDPALLPNKKQEAIQRSEYLEKQYGITDKNPLFKGWKKLLVLPPDQVRIRKLPLTDDVAIEYMPDPETRRFLTSDLPLDINDPTHKIKYDIPKDMKEKVRMSGVIPMDTDPNTGSFVYHMARRKSQYEPMGVSMIERCVNTLVLMDKIRQAQTSIASRHMTPMRIVWADQLNPDDIDNLREQVDMALVDPDYSIIANYEIHWEEMGSNGRLLDTSSEDENNLNRLLAGLGITRELLTGEGSYTGSRITLEVMNTQYLLFRELIQDYVENYLFKPIARKKGFIEYDDYGNEILLYPRLSFTRLAIRDNDQFFDAAFQLYQKGSISIDLILDILNIDPESTKEKIEKDLFTVNDSLFNEVLRNLYTSAAAPLVEKTDVVAKLAEYLKLKINPETPAAEGASRFSSETKVSPDKTDTDNKSILNPERSAKMAKLIKYFQANPRALDRVFKGTDDVNPNSKFDTKS